MIEISKISLFLIRNSLDEDGQLIAYANFIINDELLIGGVRIYKDITQPLGYRLSYPRKKTAAGDSKICFRPISFEASNIISEKIIKEFIMQRQKLIEQRDNLLKWMKSTYVK